jgi:RNA exonuclease 1
VPGRDFYLLSAEDLDENGFPISLETMHTIGIAETECHEAHMDTNGYIKLPLRQDGNLVELSEEGEIASFDYSSASMFAIDCEMCETAAGMELTRVSVVDESLKCLYDALVLPENPILDYKTQYSGITSETLQSVTKRLHDVQQELQELLPSNAILLGHSLENDLHAIKLIHDAVIDTTVLFTTREARIRFKPSLKYLTRKHLGQKIQSGNNGHCSIEDAAAVMNLVKLKLERGVEFGIPQDSSTESYFGNLAESGKQVYFLDQPFLVQRYCGNGSRVHSIVCMTDDEMVSRAGQCVSSADLLWAHLHNVEKKIRGTIRIREHGKL